jgi:toluene monooxygenase electron transfer component
VTDVDRTDIVEGGPAHRVTLDGSGESFPVGPGESILNAARRSGHWLPFECGWGSCGRCRATLVDGELTAMFPEAPAISERDQRRRRHLMCQSTPATDVVIKPTTVTAEPPDERPVVDLQGTLVDVRSLGPDIAEFTFELASPSGEPVVAHFRPGQYAVLELAAGLRRCYSMANLPGTSQVQFIAKRYEGRPGSNRLFDLPTGTAIPIELPYGDMWLRDRDRPALLIAGGTGISAILSLVRSMNGSPAWADRPVHVLYGAATRADLVCWEELHQAAADMRNLSIHGALVVTEDSWAGTRGLVTELLASLLQMDPGHDWSPAAGLVYLAGPPPMVRAVQDVLANNGIQLDRIHVDTFG